MLEADAGGDVEHDTLGPERTRELGELVVRGQHVGTDELMTAFGMALEVVGDGRESDPGADRVGGERRRRQVPLGEDEQSIGPVGDRHLDRRRRRVPVDPRVRQGGGPQVDVGGVEAVRFGRKRGIRIECRETIAGSTLREPDEAFVELAPVDGQREVVEGPARRPRS